MTGHEKALSHATRGLQQGETDLLIGLASSAPLFGWRLARWIKQTRHAAAVTLGEGVGGQALGSRPAIIRAELLDHCGVIMRDRAMQRCQPLAVERMGPGRMDAEQGSEHLDIL